MSGTLTLPDPTRSEAHLYVAYYRVSTLRQGASALGLDAQRSAVVRYLKQSNGELIAEHVEIESGKRHLNRPQLAAAIAVCKRRKATLIIAKLDRLSRNVAFISGLMEATTDFVACDMPHANRLTIHILAAIAEHEREMISARTKAALAQLKARGVKLGNPHWQAALIKANGNRKRASRPVDLQTILESYKQDGLSLRAIAKRLNDLGLKTPSGAQWFASSVQRMLEICSKNHLKTLEKT